MLTLEEFIRMNESPEIIDQPESVVDPGIRTMSPEALKRSFKKILSEGDVDVYFSEGSSGITLRGVLRKLLPNGRYELVFDMVLYPYYKIKNGMQVRSVWVKPRYRTGGISKSVYLKLVDMGYIIISDKVQLIGGYQLWKSLIKTSPYVIRVYNTQKGEFVVFDGTTELNGSNLKEDDIWKSGSAGRELVLYMSKR